MRHLPSSSAWRWVASRACPVTIDVETQIMSVFEGGLPRCFRDSSNSIALESGETCQRLAGRDTDYVFVLPLRRPAGIADGMACIELQGSRGLGAQIFERCGSVMQLLADLATPHLAWLPSEGLEPEVLRNEYLPVVGESTAPLVELLRAFSQLEETLLIAGPTGVGKSRLARYCHECSPRREQPFITLDLLACPEELQMSQLCGAKRGSYTGADRDMPGAIQRAEGGTLFIDEIDKLSLPAQAGLLRLIEERAYRPLGERGEDKRADVRFIIGTNVDLRAAIAEGRFREDLYYRIAVLMVRVPPLARRRDEIPAWANYMLERCHRTSRVGQDGGTARFEPSAVERLVNFGWPGNLRQLDNVVRRARAYCLLESNATSQIAFVTDRHLERAMRDEVDRDERSYGDSSLIAEMQTAARSFAEESLRRVDTEHPLALVHSEAFRAMVLDATIEATGSKEVALEALGLGSVLRDRNHHRVIKREAELLQRLYAIVGFEPRARPGTSGFIKVHDAKPYDATPHDMTDLPRVRRRASGDGGSNSD
jgi:DNA-binding NtrC family response regulator